MFLKIRDKKLTHPLMGDSFLRFSKENVESFMENHVTEDATIKTDGGVDIRDGLMTTDKVDHEAKPMYGFKNQLDHHLPWVHHLIGNMKAKLLGIYHGVSPKYVERYIAEYLYRFNRRWCPDQLQTRMITACLTMGPTSYADVSR